MNFMHLIPLSCLAVASATGDSGVPGSHKTVTFEVGDDAILPCQLETPFDKKTQKVEWTCKDKDVHLYRKGRDDLTYQNKHFNGRTALFYDEMAKGNISLKLSQVNEQDEGNYTCRVISSQYPQCNILLNVVLHNNNLTENKSNTEELNKPEPKPEPTTFWEEHGHIVYVVIAVIGGIAIVIVIVGFSRRNNNAAPNEGYDMVAPEAEAEAEAEAEPQPEAEAEPEVEAEPQPEAEAEPQPEAEAEAEAEAEVEAEAEAEAEPQPEPEAEAEPEVEAEPEAEPEAQPVPGPNNDDGTSVSPYKRGHNRQNNQGEEPGQTQDNESEEHGKQQ
ncbi:protein TsetseEP-like isoform X2 [Epinephelus moara]|uniref:protein TsetseEP-like isoform X2 n=1 Tax=Epinephelus moara TaxID=300413 RepID=UPI00214E2732|nr:protein TsetseEP-like isoform X2 [Epinephelus moara]